MKINHCVIVVLKSSSENNVKPGKHCEVAEVWRCVGSERKSIQLRRSPLEFNVSYKQLTIIE